MPQTEEKQPTTFITIILFSRFKFFLVNLENSQKNLEIPKPWKNWKKWSWLILIENGCFFRTKGPPYKQTLNSREKTPYLADEICESVKDFLQIC